MKTIQSTPHKKPTIYDLSRHTGLSKTTISRVVSGNGYASAEAREAILRAARELGYEGNYYAQRLKGGCNKTVGIYNADMQGISQDKTLSIQELLAKRGFHAPLHALGFASGEWQQEMMSTLRRQKPAAIVCFNGGMHPKALDELRRYRDEGGVAVCFDHQAPEEFEQIVFDREDAAYRSARSFAESGHERIGLCTHGFDPHDSPAGRGFARALREAGVPVNPEWLWKEYSFEEAGARLAQKFLDLRERPTAMCIIDDRSAVAFTNHVLRAGVKVPDDVSVIGHNDISLSRHSFVPLSVVSHPIAQIADHVVEFVASRIEKRYEAEPRHIVVSGQLVLRESTRAFN